MSFLNRMMPFGMNGPRFVPLRILALLLVFLPVASPVSFPSEDSHNRDWPMWGGGPQRNAVSQMLGAPTSWDVREKKNLRWVAQLGSQTYATPVVAGGMVFIGTNNDSSRNPDQTGDRGVLMAFHESDGKLLWQATSRKLAAGVNDWPYVGVCSSPLVEGDRLYYVNNRCEVVCLDTLGFGDGENDGPFKEEEFTQRGDADIVWKLDMIGELGVFPHNASNSSPVSFGELIFVGTSNGQNEDHTEVPSAKAPTIIALAKQTGGLVWSDASPGDRILNGQWASPAVGRIDGTDQVVMGQGDGWIRSYEAATGGRLWEFDTNPKDSVYPKTRNSILATAVVYENHVYIANGQDPENGEGKGHLYCIDATKRGDITRTGLVWHYDKIRRSLSTPAIHEGLLYCPDFSGFLHCLDAKTGSVYWVHDTLAAVWGSPVIVGGNLYLGDEDGDIVILKTGLREEVIAEVNMGGPVYSTLVPAHRTLFINTFTQLFALERAKQ